MRRGDNIPSVGDYAHWGEDAEAVWYSENRYDMEHADEEMDDDYDLERDYDEPEPDIDECFDTEDEAREYYESVADSAHSVTLSGNNERGWFVEGHTIGQYVAWKERRYRGR